MAGASIRSNAEISSDEIKPQHLMAEIDRLSGGEAIVASDVGQHQMWARAVYPLQSSAAVDQFGRARARWDSDCLRRSARSWRGPDKLVFAIVGDGGFQMSIPELATVANQRCR